MKTVFVVTYVERHLRKLVPVIKVLEQDKNIDLRLVLMTQEEKIYADSIGLRYLMLDAYTSEKRQTNFDPAWGVGALMNALEKERPGLFIAMEVNLILRNAVHYCRSHGIRTLIMQHGAPNHFSLHAFVPFEADYFAAWGDFSKEILCANGVPQERIVITGAPEFDALIPLRPSRDILLKEAGLAGNYEKMFVFTTQAMGPGGCPSDDEQRAAYREICKVASVHPLWALIVQIHPTQCIDDVRLLLPAESKSPNIAIGVFAQTSDLIAACDGMVTYFSTTAIEALVLDKPLFLINLSEDRDFYPFYRMGAADAAFSAEELNEKLSLFFSHPGGDSGARKQAMEYVAYRRDGKATERVIQLVYKMLEGEL
jgi:hypothetical protein